MVKKKEDEKPMIRFMSDEEFEAMKLKENKSSFLDDLISASKKSNGSRFSVKKMNHTKKEESSDDENDDEYKLSEVAEEMQLSVKPLDINDKIEPIDEDSWNDMLDQFNNLSPIDDITMQDRLRYRRKAEGDKYDAMFDKERSMLNDVLSDLQSRSKIVNTSLKNMVKTKPSGGRGGVSKVFTELVEASNSLDLAKLNVIKELVNVKKSAIDLRIKEQKNLPQEDENDVDTVADQFFKRLTGAGPKQMQGTMVSKYANDGGEPVYDENGELMNQPSFNLSQPLSMAGYDGYEDIDEIDADAHGYIRNEANGVDVFVYRYDDGSLEFVALDQDGQEVYDYELPSNDLLYHMTVKPMSPYAYDEYGRQYKIIDKSSAVDLDDLDDPELDNYVPTDKYEY